MNTNLTTMNFSGPIFDITKKVLNQDDVELFGLPPIGTTKIYTKVTDVANLITNLVENIKNFDFIDNCNPAPIYNLCSNREFSISEIFNIISNMLQIQKKSYFNYTEYLGDLQFLRASSNSAKLQFNWHPDNEGIIEYGVECALSLLGQEERTLVGTSEKF